jgi:hypothetical protein
LRASQTSARRKTLMLAGTDCFGVVGIAKPIVSGPGRNRGEHDGPSGCCARPQPDSRYVRARPAQGQTHGKVVVASTVNANVRPAERTIRWIGSCVACVSSAAAPTARPYACAIPFLSRMPIPI